MFIIQFLINYEKIYCGIDNYQKEDIRLKPVPKQDLTYTNTEFKWKYELAAGYQRPYRGKHTGAGRTKNTGYLG